MRDEIERVIERADGHHGPDRHSPRESDPAIARRAQIHRDLLPPLTDQKLPSQPRALRRPIHLNQRIPQRLASLQRNLHRQPVTIRQYHRRRALQNLNAAKSGNVFAATCDVMSRGESRFNIFGRGSREVGHKRPGILV